MSEVLSAFRQLGGEAFDSLTDDELTLFIGQNFPQLKDHPRFGTQYSAVKEERDKSILEGLEASIANDEVKLAKPTPMGLVERIGLGLASGTANVVKSVGAAALGAPAFSPAVNIPAVRDVVKGVVGGARRTEEEYAEAGEAVGGGLPGAFAQALGAGAASLVPTVVAAYFTGMPGAMATGGVMQFGDTYDSAYQAYRSQGMSDEVAHEEALKPAILSGIVTAGLSGIGGPERFFSRLARGKVAQDTAKNVLKEIFKSAGLEGVEEGVDQFIQGFIRQATFEPEKTFGQIATESAMAAAVGMTLGAVLPGASMVGSKMRKSASVISEGIPTEQKPGAKPEVQAPERPVSQMTAGELLTGREQYDLAFGGKATPIANASIDPNGNVKLDLEGGQSLGFAPDELLQVKPKAAPIDAQSTIPGAPPVIEGQPGEAPPVIDEAALRAFPAPVAALDRFINWAMPRDPGAPPPIALDVDTPFPDFQPTPVSKQVFTQPYGAGKWFLIGKALDPNARHITEVGEMVNTLAGEVGVGEAIASGFGIQIQGQWDSAFKVNENGMLIGVEPTQTGQSLAPSDVLESLLENENSYRITPEQKAALAQIKEATRLLSELENKYGIFDAAEDGERSDAVGKGYFPRIVIRRPGEKKPRGGRGGTMGAVPFFEKSRFFEREEDGIAAEYEYEPSIERRFVTRVQRLYKRIAEKRFLADPDLPKLARQTREAELRAQLRPFGPMTPKAEEAMNDRIHGILSEGTAKHQAFQNYVFPPEVVEELNKAFPNSDNFLREKIARFNNFLRLLQLGYDLGVMTNQGVITFFRSPPIWAKATAMSLRALRSPKGFSLWAQNNLVPIRELAQLGSPIGRLQEFMAGAERGEILERAPGIGPVTRAFARQFHTFLDVAKVELYKAHRASGEEPSLELARSIESVLLTSRMRSIGLGKNQTFIEQLLLRAPSYYRAGLNIVAGVGQRGVSGRVARRAFGSYVFGGIALYAGVGMMLGMKWEELVKRLNPADSEFLNWRYEMENGTTINFGLGGIIRSFMQLLGRIASSITKGEWDKFSKGTSEENPLVRWYRGHAAPGPAVVWDVFSGEDYMGKETGMGVMIEEVLPLWAQPLVADWMGRDTGEREKTTAEQVATTAASAVGVSSHQEGFGRSRMAELDRIAGEQAKKPYSQLSVQERVRALSAFDKTPVATNRPEVTPDLQKRFIELDQDNRDQIEAELTDEAQDALDRVGLRVPVMKLQFRAGGRNIVLTEDERERFIELIAEEASASIEKNAARLEKQDDREKREEMFSDLMTAAKAKALATLKKELPNAE